MRNKHLAIKNPHSKVPGCPKKVKNSLLSHTHYSKKIKLIDQHIIHLTQTNPSTHH